MEHVYSIVGMIFILMVLLFMVLIMAGEVVNKIYNNKLKNYKRFLIAHLISIDRWFASDSNDICWFAKRLAARIKNNDFHAFDISIDRDAFRQHKKDRDKK